jgi:hypothetical protein
MEGLLLLAAEITVIGIVVWVIAHDHKSPEQLRAILDKPPSPRKPRFPWTSRKTTQTQRPRRPGRTTGHRY